VASMESMMPRFRTRYIVETTEVARRVWGFSGIGDQ
jgi:hypothetical protein